MALSELEKVFVYVGEGNADTFKEAHVGDGVDATDAYYKKVTFLEETGEIATRGHVFGGAQVDVTVDASNNSFTSNGTEYTLSVTDGQISLKPYKALSVSSVQLFNGTSQLSNSTVEYDTAVSKKLTKIKYTVAGTNPLDKISVKVEANGTTTWAVGTSATVLEDITDKANGVTYEVDLSEDPIEISSSTGSASIKVTVYAQDTKQTSPVSNSATVSLAHGRAYIVSNTQPTDSNFTTIATRTVVTSKPSSITLKGNATTPAYGWFAFPKSWGTPTLTDKATGLGMTMKEYDTAAGDYDIASNYSDRAADAKDYTVWRSGQLLYEDQVVTIKW